MTDDPDTSPRATYPILTSWQTGFLLGPPVVLLLLTAGMLHFKTDYISVLYQHPLGIKMLVNGATFFALGEVLFFFGCVILNRWLPPVEANRLTRALLFCALEALHLILCVAPLFYVVLVGPAAIRILEQLPQ